MTAHRRIDLVSSGASAVILPDEGGVASTLTVAGAEVLARTPWADDVGRHDQPASTENEWVRRWRGGWQLCFPTAGQPEPRAQPRQSFHGTASQAAWAVVDESADVVAMSWQDEHGLVANREWRLRPDGLEVTTCARNEGDATRVVTVAEHLILGGDLAAPALDGRELRLGVPPGTRLADLDYAGTPVGHPVTWPGRPSERWDRIDADTPARVAALSAAASRHVTVGGPVLTADVTWSGLDHALVWEELARSQEDPWDGGVVAIGVEPTSTPHGAGTGAGYGGALTLAPGEEMTWTVALRITTTRSGGGKEDA